jgi:hypothetical protein
VRTHLLEEFAVMPPYGTKPTVASRFGITERTVLNWLNAGHITGFRAPGSRSLLFDLDEVARGIETNPSMRPASKHFSSKARIVDLPGPVSVVIEPVASTS